MTGRVRLTSGCMQMLDVLRGLYESGCLVSLLCEGMSGGLERGEGPFRVVTWRQVGRRMSALQNEENFRKLFGQAPADLIHVYGTRLGRRGWRLIRRFSAPVVLTPLSAREDVGEVARVQRECAGVIALNYSMREALVNRAHVPREKVSVVRPGVDLSLFEGARPLGSAAVNVVGMAGPFEANGGQRLFLEAARRVLDSGRRAEFVLAGDGREEKRLRALALKLDLSKRVTFATRLSNYRGVISAMDVFVRTATEGTLGYTVLEAMSAQKPVVACATAGVVEIVEDGVTGWLVAKNDAEAVAKAVGLLIDDPALARRMGAAARARVAEHYSMASVVKKTLEVYESAREFSGRALRE